MKAAIAPRFFDSQAAFRAWLAANHRKATELWVAFHKVHRGKGGLTYAEAVDEALCFGWIDGVKKRIDEEAYMHRFTPRSPKSIWSEGNTRRAEALLKAGRMAPAGADAFAARDPKRAGLYSFENRDRGLDADSEKRFRAQRKAWKFFQEQPPGYRRIAAFWVASAKREETRARRLAQLIADSARGERIAMLSGTPKTPR